MTRRSFVDLWKNPSTVWIDVTLEQVVGASELAMDSSIRGGADVIIAFTAKSHGLPLVTLDQGLREQARDHVTIHSPDEVPVAESK